MRGLVILTNKHCALESVTRETLESSKVSLAFYPQLLPAHVQTRGIYRALNVTQVFGKESKDLEVLSIV